MWGTVGAQDESISLLCGDEKSASRARNFPLPVRSRLTATAHPSTKPWTSWAASEMHVKFVNSPWPRAISLDCSSAGELEYRA
jgi:hypothetical protein